MADELVIGLTAPTSIDLISLTDLKAMLNVSDATLDLQFQMLITQVSDQIAEECNRAVPGGYGFGKGQVEETWRCVAPVCCPDGTCRVWLARYPVFDDDIDSVESPRGTLIDPTDYVLEPGSGKLILLAGCSSEIVVTYSGGYDLPDGAPPALQNLAGLMVQQNRGQIMMSTTSGAGIRMLAHKDSRVIYFAPKDMVQVAKTGGVSGISGGQVQNVLTKFTRYFI